MKQLESHVFNSFKSFYCDLKIKIYHESIFENNNMPFMYTVHHQNISEVKIMPYLVIRDIKNKNALFQQHGKYNGKY